MGGVVNLDHSKYDVVGYPVEAKITDNGMFLKAKLLKNEIGNKIWDNMNALAAEGWPRRYGFSIEGHIQERDNRNPRVIKRAFVTNVALTTNPVNPNTWADFAKSLAPGALEYSPDYAYRPIAKAFEEYYIQQYEFVNGLGKLDEHYFDRNGCFYKGLDSAQRYFETEHELPTEVSKQVVAYIILRQDKINNQLNSDARRLI